LKVAVIGLALFALTFGAVVARPAPSAQADQLQAAGARGLVAAIVQAQLDDVHVIDSSFNHNRVLNNVLNNNDVDIPILSYNQCVAICNSDILNDLTAIVTLEDIDVDTIVGVGILSGGFVVLFV